MNKKLLFSLLFCTNLIGFSSCEEQELEVKPSKDVNIEDVKSSEFGVLSGTVML